MCVDECGGRCCRTSHWIVLTYDDMKRLAAHLHDVPSRPDRPWIDFDPFSGWRFAFDACPFLEEDSRCRIYHDRPQGCRTFPVGPEVGCLAWPRE